MSAEQQVRAILDKHTLTETSDRFDAMVGELVDVAENHTYRVGQYEFTCRALPFGDNQSFRAARNALEETMAKDGWSTSWADICSDGSLVVFRRNVK